MGKQHCYAFKPCLQCPIRLFNIQIVS